MSPQGYEVEQKFPVRDLRVVEARLLELGAQPMPVQAHADLYFAHPSRDFGQTDEALRIRRIGDENFVTYKGPKLDATTKTRREIELPLPPGADGEAAGSDLFTALGFRKVSEVRKTRRPLHLLWQGWPVEAALDEVESLGSFVELEILAEHAQIDDAKRALASLAARLGLEQSERRSYLELLLGL